MKNKNRRLRILSFIVIGYMLLALLWWAILLQRKNNETFTLKADLLQERYMTTAGVATMDVTTLSEYGELKEEYKRQMYMIYGETVVFALTLIMGIFFINKAYQGELLNSEKQKNFLLSITHELKSPLASINLIFSTFKKRDLKSEQIKELSTDGLKESERLEKLFNKILISTRLGKGYSFQKEAYNVSSIVNNTVEIFQKNHPDVKVNTQIESDIIKEVDKEGFISVVTNLLENAEKYSLDTKEIDITLREKHENIYLSIADQGVGIDKLEREHIFEQFYRVGSEDTRSTKGTGLGLYIVKEIVNGHNGKISVSDNNGRGTKFEIVL